MQPSLLAQNRPGPSKHLWTMIEAECLARQSTRAKDAVEAASAGAVEAPVDDDRSRTLGPTKHPGRGHSGGNIGRGCVSTHGRRYKLNARAAEAPANNDTSIVPGPSKHPRSRGSLRWGARCHQITSIQRADTNKACAASTELHAPQREDDAGSRRFPNFAWLPAPVVARGGELGGAGGTWGCYGSNHAD
jgi:hypothetical protein